MSTFAAVMTGKGTGAISTIQVFGNSAEAVVKKIFKPAGHKPLVLKPGRILLGTITDLPRRETVDQVTIGCEGPESFAIHCHGNPLIAETIMELLKRHGAELLTAEQLMAKKLTQVGSASTIELEAGLMLSRAATLQGSRIIANQIRHGLAKKAGDLIGNIDKLSLEQIAAQAERILANTKAARPLIYGSRAVLAGPTNSGKSTLFNYLCGGQKAVVTDIKGTTRDWVGAKCRIGPLSVELIDTAGLDEILAAKARESVERAAQQKTTEILRDADMVLLVLDNSEAADRLNPALVKKIKNKKVVTLLNKSDLPSRFDAGRLPQSLPKPVRISAKFGTGIEGLLDKIVRTCGAADLDPQSPICFTNRQKVLLRQLRKATSRHHAKKILSTLLNGPISEIQPPQKDQGVEFPV